MSNPHDHTDAVRLLGTLDRDLDTPSTVDIRLAMDVGARTRRRRRAAGYGLVATATALALAGGSALVAGDRPVDRQGAEPLAAATSSGPPPAVAPTFGPPRPRPTNCTVSRLPTPQQYELSSVGGADPTGRYLVGTGSSDVSIRTLIVWDNGQPTKVMSSVGDPKLTGVTSAGVAVGSEWRFPDTRPPQGPWRPRPLLYRDGEVTELLGVPDGHANAINGSGVIVGWAGTTTSTAVVWRLPALRAVALPGPAGMKESSAVAVDEDGTIAGHVVIEGGPRATPYVWLPDGTHRALPIPAEFDGWTGGQAYGIRNGWVIGTITPAGKDRQAVRWNLRTGEMVALPLKGRPTAVNAHGWVAGGDLQGRATVIIDGAPLVLPDLQGHRADDGNSAMTVSDDGRTIGGLAFDRSGRWHAVVWRCS